MPVLANERRFQRRVILPIASIISGLILTVIVTVLYLADQQTKDAVIRQGALAAGALTIQREELEKVTDDYAYWDEAFDNIVVNPNAPWTDLNISLPIFKKYGYQLILVVDDAGHAYYGMRNGQRGTTALINSLSGGFDRLLATASSTPSPVTASELITVDGRPAFAAVSKLRPYKSTAPTKAPERYLVFVNILDEAQLDRLSKIYLLPNLHFASAENPGKANIILRTGDKQTSVALAWTGADPGKALVLPLLPILALLLSGFIGLTTLVLRKALAAAVRLRQAEAKALSDGLTGLPNRTALFRLGEELLADRPRLKSKFALLYLDLDGFKSVNDRIGHHAGDVVLQTTAQRILKVLPETAMFARLGGDEFAIILRGLDKPQTIRPVGETIIETVRQPIEFGGQTVSVGVTLGVAIAPLDSRDFVELVDKADSALCHAKRVRKGTIHFFRDALTVQSKSLDEIESSR